MSKREFRKQVSVCNPTQVLSSEHLAFNVRMTITIIFFGDLELKLKCTYWGGPEKNLFTQRFGGTYHASALRLV